MTPTRTVGANIRARREKLGLTRRALAAELGTTETTLYRWETGRHTPGVPELHALAEALGCQAGTLLRGT